MNQYDTPTNFGIPNPYGPRTHNWKGGPYNEGSLFHGPIYTRPSYHPTWIQQTLNGQTGLGCKGCGSLGADPEPTPATPQQLLMWLAIAAVGIGIFVYTARPAKG